MRVAVRRFHFHHARAHFQHGNVKSSAAEVVHRDRFVALLVQPVRQRRRRWLVNDAHHFQPGNFARLLGRLPLRVVEVRRHGDNRLGHLFAQKILRRGLQLSQDHRGNLWRAVYLPENLHARIVMVAFHHFVRDALHLIGHFIVAPAHEPLDRIHGVLGIRHCLPLRHLSHETLARLCNGHHGRRRPRPFLVGDYHRFAALHHSHYGVRRSQVNSNNLTHRHSSFLNLFLSWSARKMLNPMPIQPGGPAPSPERNGVYRLSVRLSSFLITVVMTVFSLSYTPIPSKSPCIINFSLIFVNPSIMLRFRNWRRTSEGASRVRLSKFVSGVDS